MTSFNVGVVYFDKTEKELKDDLAKNRMLTEGVALIDLYDLINLLEIHNAGKPELTLQSLKKDIMQALGKIKEDEKTTKA